MVTLSLHGVLMDDRARPSISVIVPTYGRNQVLVDTIHALIPLLRRGDELVVVDQTGEHERDVVETLDHLVKEGSIRWIQKRFPNQAEAMNVGARVAKGEILLFLDDDIVPSPNLLEGHREALGCKDPPPATCGQVLQPWHEEPVQQVEDFGLGFDAAYDCECEIMSLMAGNYAIRKETYFRVGGMDENFEGANYRIDAEMSHRIRNVTGQKVRFVPDASLRHLLAGGGNRAFGQKDSWGHIGGSIGDYYFALKWLPMFRSIPHIIRRMVRAPLNRKTIRRPWMVLSLFMREQVAFLRALGKWKRRHERYIKPLEAYTDVEGLPPLCSVGSSRGKKA